MKNLRVKLVLLVLTALAVAGGLGLYGWWRSGQRPPGPADWFDDTERSRARERLERFRIPQDDAVRLLKEVSEHLEQARSLSFTDQASARQILQGLKMDVHEINRKYSVTLQDLETGRPSTWTAPFETFVDTSMESYDAALELARVLARNDWSAVSLKQLTDYVAETKTTCAQLTETEPWRGHGYLRRTLYPALEEAYRRRAESDPQSLQAKLVEPAPPLLRWYYARLYQSAKPLPTPFCAEALRENTDELSALAEDVRAALPRDDLAAWRFPTDRANYLERLAPAIEPLEQAESVRDWLDFFSAASTNLTNVMEESRAGGAAPDIAVKYAAGRLVASRTGADLAWKILAANRSLAGLKYFGEAADSLAKPDEPLAPCLWMAWSRAAHHAREVAEAQELLMDLSDPRSPDLRTTISKLNAAVVRCEASVGIELHQVLMREMVSAWWLRNRPARVSSEVAADLLRYLYREGLLPDPELEDAARLLDRLAAGRTADDASRDLLAEWRALAGRLYRYPRIREALREEMGSAMDNVARQDLAAALATGSEPRMRAAAEDILHASHLEEGHTVREEAKSLLMILQLPERVAALDVSVPGELAQRNAALIPQAPDEDSILATLFDERVRPMTDYTDAVANFMTIDTTTEEGQADAAQVLSHALASRYRVLIHYPGWPALDLRLAEAVGGKSPACLPLQQDELWAVEEGYKNASQWAFLDADARAIFGRHEETSALLLALLDAHPSDTFGALIEGAAPILEDPTYARPALTRFLDLCRASMELHQQVSAAASSYRKMADLTFEGARQLRGAYPTCLPAAGAIREWLQTLEADVQALETVVREDYQLVHGPPAEPRGQAERVMTQYLSFSHGELTPPLGQYARNQAGALQHYRQPARYTLEAGEQAVPKRLALPLSRLGTNVTTLGYGRRTRGRGDGLELWIDAGSGPHPLLRASWREDPEEGRISLKNITMETVMFTWEEGQPISLGIDIPHTLDDNRDVVPDRGSGRSRWNPLNYYRYRAETHRYPLVEYSSLESMVRSLLAPRTDTHDITIALARLVAAPDADAEPRLLYRVSGLPEGRDFDWPAFTPEPSAGDAEALGQELLDVAEDVLGDLMGHMD